MVCISKRGSFQAGLCQTYALQGDESREGLRFPGNQEIAMQVRQEELLGICVCALLCSHEEREAIVCKNVRT